VVVVVDPSGFATEVLLLTGTAGEVVIVVLLSAKAEEVIAANIAEIHINLCKALIIFPS
jgi:hypothetical protein